MSISSEIDRINANVANTYSALEGAGADMPAQQNTDNLPETVLTIKAVRYDEQNLTDAQKAQARANIGIIGDETLPDYWVSALENGAEEINTALCNAGRNKSAFLFYTDSHWNANYKRSPMLLKYLYEHTGMTKTFFGGDIVVTEGTDYDTMKYLWEWREMIKNLPNHHSVVGNHDDGNTTNNLFTEQYVYGFLFAPEETPDMVMGNGMYYYIDNAPEKTRYIFLDTAYKGMDVKQTEFLNQALLNTAEGWHIVVVAHVWYVPDYSQTGVKPMPLKGLHADASKVVAILDDYNSRNGVFADCGAWVEFCIGGHIHYDYNDTTTTGIPIILVESDSHDTRGTYSKAQGTTGESAVSGIIADYDNRKIYVVRIGRGESRDITVTSNIVSYTNQIPISTDASGAIYNGVGYKDGVRLGSDGADRTGAPTDATGFIPCTTADTLYFKNCQIYTYPTKSGTSTYQELACYDSNKAFIHTRYLTYDVQMEGKDFDVDANGCLTRYNCKDLWSNTAFVRISGDYIGADSIITKNEPIE